MTTVRDILATKGYSVFTIQPQDSLQQALILMADKQIGALPVIRDGKLAGIFSERDFARLAVSSAGSLDLNRPIEEIMQTPVYFIEPAQSIEDCMVVMTAKKLRHLPVMDEGRLIGMVSITDVVKYQLAEKQKTIDMLEHFLWVNLI